MRIYPAMIASVLTVLPSMTLAATSDKLAEQLATVIAAEAFCDLTYDQAAIEAWIEKRIAADDMDFANTLNLYISAVEYDQKDMKASQKTALCAQTRRIAKSFGFLK